MKKYISLSLILCSMLLLNSCKKEGDNIFNMFTDVTVEFHNNNPQNIVDHKVVNVGDEIWIDYTVTSNKEDMYTMNLLEVGTSSPTKYPLNESQRRSASGLIKLKATNRTGRISYRLYPTDKTGIYLGDGYKTLTIDVNNDFTFTTERFLFPPNTILANPNTGEVTHPIFDPAAESFLSLTTGETFSYSKGSANSSKIDLGLYRTLTARLNSTTKLYDFTSTDMIYSVGATPSPVPGNNFDVATWPTKRRTLFSALVSGGSTTFNNHKTGLSITDAAKKLGVNSTVAVASGGSMYYFLTPEGKYGAILINNNGFDRVRGNYLNVFIKYAF